MRRKERSKCTMCAVQDKKEGRRLPHEERGKGQMDPEVTNLMPIVSHSVGKQLTGLREAAAWNTLVHALERLYSLPYILIPEMNGSIGAASRKRSHDVEVNVIHRVYVIGVMPFAMAAFVYVRWK